MPRLGTACYGRRGELGHGKASHGPEWLGEAGYGKAGKAWQGARGVDRHGLVWQAWRGAVRRGESALGAARSGMARHGNLINQPQGGKNGLPVFLERPE